MFKTKPFNNKYSGFLLLELLIAIMVFGIISMAIASFHASISVQRQEAINFSKALEIANNCVEEFSSTTQKLPFKVEKDNFFIRIYEYEKSLSTNYNLLKIEVEWTTKRKRKQNINMIFGILKNEKL